MKELFESDTKSVLKNQRLAKRSGTLMTTLSQHRVLVSLLLLILVSVSFFIILGKSFVSAASPTFSLAQFNAASTQLVDAAITTINKNPKNFYPVRSNNFRKTVLALQNDQEALAALKPTTIKFDSKGHFFIPLSFRNSFTYQDKIIEHSDSNEFIFYSIDPSLQQYSEELLIQTKAPHVAIVVMDPNTGQILSLAERSKSIKGLSTHASFPAASLFKLVTTAAALETSSMGSDSTIRFRGGTYTLRPWNYKADRRRDWRIMSLPEALGHSCNPVFGRIALNHLTPAILDDYANAFGFNTAIPFESSLPESCAQIPENDYQFSRTAAGFGDVYVSPIHAALVMSGIANGGLLLQPSVIDEILSAKGTTLYRSQPKVLRRIIKTETAHNLLDMMEYTTTLGTSKREFMRRGKSLLGDIRVAGKTGTLRGEDPSGINNWFIGAAPIAEPEIAVAVIVVYPGHISTRASRIARKLLLKYFESPNREI